MILSERFAQIYFPHLLFQIYLLFHVFSLLTSFQKVFNSIPQIFIKCLSNVIYYIKAGHGVINIFANSKAYNLPIYE